MRSFSNNPLVLIVQSSARWSENSSGSSLIWIALCVTPEYTKKSSRSGVTVEFEDQNVGEPVDSTSNPLLWMQDSSSRPLRVLSLEPNEANVLSYS